MVCLAGGAQAASVNSGHVQLELVPAAASIAPGGTVYVALHQKILHGWHTYWRNPGDAGEPPTMAWTLPPGWSAGGFVWPAPRRLPVGPLMDYGYEGEVYLPVPVTAPRTARPGTSAPLKAAVSLLVCKDICVPEDAVLQLDLPVAAVSAGGSPNPAIAAALASAPKPAGLNAAMAVKDGKLLIAVTGPTLRGVTPAEVYFYPYDSTVIDHAKPQAVERGPGGLTLALAPGYAFKKGPAPQAITGALAVDGHAYEITARPGVLSPSAGGLGPVAGLSRPGPGAPGGGADALGLPLALGFAFLGGLILNLMPCVFPILSMKAMALAAHADRRPRAQSLAFLAGVLITFVGLAALLIAAKAAGAAVGWGFQLQAPPVVAALALLMLLIGLNLSGVFEAGLSLQGAGAGAHAGGLAGSLLTGVLAVVVAAPCTAPFMAGAIAYALTQSEWAALGVFAALGLGFAAPFIILSFTPALLRRLPRPGPWMEGLKKALAFPMYGAAAWLVWVLTLQSGAAALAALLAAAVILALAAWLFGVAQRAQQTGARFRAVYLLSGLAALGAVGLAVAGLKAPAVGLAPAAAATAVPRGDELASEPFSPQRLAELQSQRKPVFVNFTAAWCITCQVNERAALSSPRVAQAFAKAGAALLTADWTRRDAVIAETLAQHGRVGVPLYLVYGADGGPPAVLPQILTEGTVVAALQKAAGATS